MEVVVRNRWQTERFKTELEGESMTVQDAKDECDINRILAKFNRTGVIDHVAKYEPQYGEMTGVDFQDAMFKVSSAQTMFQELPAATRRKFDDDPAKFLDFVSDKANRDQFVELGIASDSLIAEAASAAADAIASVEETGGQGSPESPGEAPPGGESSDAQ